MKKGESASVKLYNSVITRRRQENMEMCRKLGKRKLDCTQRRMKTMLATAMLISCGVNLACTAAAFTQTWLPRRQVKTLDPASALQPPNYGDMASRRYVQMEVEHDWLLRSNIEDSSDQSVEWSEVLLERFLNGELKEELRGIHEDPRDMPGKGAKRPLPKTDSNSKGVDKKKPKTGVRSETTVSSVSKPASKSKSEEVILNKKPEGNRSPTMPGFSVMSQRQQYREADRKRRERKTGKPLQAPAQRRKQEGQQYGQAMYEASLAVPDSLVQFGKEIHQEDRISRKEEIELGEKTQAAIRLQNLYEQLESKLGREPTDEEWCAAAGKINSETIRLTIEDGLEAKNKLVTANLRMVQAVVNTYIRNGLPGKYNAGDLMQEGIVALMRAAEKFDPDLGWKFSTYAMYWVRSAVKRSQVYQSRAIPVPTRLHENRKRLLRVEKELIGQSGGRRPTTEELGRAVGMSPIQVERCISAMKQRSISLDASIQFQKKPNDIHKVHTLAEALDGRMQGDEPDELVMSHLRESMVETMNRHLTPLEVELLMLRFGLDENRRKLDGRKFTIAELGQLLDLKPDKVRRLLKNSISQLRDAGLDEWFEYERELQTATSGGVRAVA